MNAARKYVKRTLGRRPEDKLEERIKRITKLCLAVLAAATTIYFAAMGAYMQVVLANKEFSRITQGK